MSDVAQEQATPSVEIGRRAAQHEELIAEVGCPDMTIASAQLDWPLADRKVAGR